jgi:HK97 family phage portal protein
MSFFSTFLGGDDEEKVANADALTWSALGMPMSKTGLPVNELTALRVAVVWACCRVLTEDVGKLPLKLLKEDDDGREAVAKDHPLHRVISRRPNEWQTSMEWRMTMLLHALLAKGGYSYISRSAKGEVLELIPLLPGNVMVHQDSARTSLVRGSRLQRRVDDAPPRGRACPPRPLVERLSALSVFSRAAEAIGLAMAAEETQARLHGQGARPGGVAHHPEPAHERPGRRPQEAVQRRATPASRTPSRRCSSTTASSSSRG